MTPHGRRLSKREAETLLRDFDSDPVEALSVALRIVLGRPVAGWHDLLDASGLEPERRAALAECDPDELDRLAQVLNEDRRLQP